MNSTPRTATRGGSKSKSDSNTGKGHKTDSKRDVQKNTESSKNQASAVTHTNPVTDELSLKMKIAQIMTIIQKTEDEVITALHDADHDLDKAVSILLEGSQQGEWETSGKKKKNRQASAAKAGETSTSRNNPPDQDVEDADSQPLSANQDRERSRGRGSGASRPRGRGNNSRGPGRGRGNNKENEAGSGDDSFRSGNRDGFRRGGRGMSNGPGGRGGRGGRGGGGRLGSRTFQGRDGRDKPDGDRFPSTIDTWNPTGSQDTNEKPLKMDTWRDNFPAAEDWDNEEYTGSLADSKVFTPSALETSVVAPEPIQDTSNQDLLSMATGSGTGQDFHHSSALNSSPQPVGVGTLNTAQAQYFTQLTQQTAENLKASAPTSVYGQTESLKTAVGINNSSTFAPTGGYGQSATYGQNNFAPTTFSAQTTAYPTTGSANAYSATTTPVNAYSATTTPGNAYSATTTPGNAYSATTTPGNTYSATTAPGNAYSSTNQGYSNANSSSFSVYPSSGGSYATTNYSTTSSNTPYDNTTASSDGNTVTSQPPRSKPQRPRVPPPSKIPSTAVEMPEDSISTSVSSLDVQFGCLEFGSDSASFDTNSEQGTKFQSAPSSVAAADVASSGASTVGLDTTVSQQTTLNAYSSAKNVVVAASQQSTLVAGLSSKGLTSSDGLSIQSSGDHKTNYATQQTRSVNSSSGLDGTKCDVGNLSYASAPTATNYSAYQSQKNSSNVYQQSSYSTSAYTTPQTTYSNAVPSSYSTTAYSNQPSVNNSFPNSSYSSQQPNVSNYATSGATYPTANSFQNTSQNYQSGSVYGTALSSGYSAVSGYQNSYSTGTTAKLNSVLAASKDVQEYSAPATSNISSTTNTTSSLLTSPSTPQAVTTASSKITPGAMKSSVVPNLHPPMMGTPQYIVGGASMPFYHQTPMYGYEDLQLIHSQRLPHMAAGGYYDMGYSAPTSLATGRDALTNVAYTVADARYSTRGDNNASPVPSTLSQQTANAAHQQPIINSFPPGYTYVYNAVPGSFQYSTPIYPVPSAGNAHGSSSNQYAKPASYGSTYGAGYDGLNQTADYSKSAYVSGAVKTGVGASVSSANTASDLYGKTHTALGKVNSYDKQGFHSATPPPFGLAAGQGAGMATSGGYPPQLFISTMPPHQQHHSTALIASHLQDSSNSSVQRSQSAAQGSKSTNKQNYNAYWPTN